MRCLQRALPAENLEKVRFWVSSTRTFPASSTEFNYFLFLTIHLKATQTGRDSSNNGRATSSPLWLAEQSY